MPVKTPDEVVLFRGDDQIETFRNMARIFPTRRVSAPSVARPIPAGPTRISLPERFVYEGTPRDTAAFLDKVATTGMLVVHRGQAVFEGYWNGTTASTQTMSFSVVKSFVATLVACALRDRLVASLEDAVDRYVPALAGSGYGGVSIRDVLQMSSGVRWNEDYSDPDSDVSRFDNAFRGDGSFDAVARSLLRNHAPGTYNCYNSCDTHVLGMVLRAATGMQLSQYLEQELWHPLGMEDDAFWILDSQGMEFAAAGLNATLRDYAKLGLLYANGGVIGGQQLLPEGWIEGCSTAMAPHLVPGKRTNASSPLGYGYQWWLPDDRGPYTAIGVYNQFIWIDPQRDVIIAKTSANPLYGIDMAQSEAEEIEHFALFNEIAASIA